MALEHPPLPHWLHLGTIPPSIHGGGGWVRRGGPALGQHNHRAPKAEETSMWNESWHRDRERPVTPQNEEGERCRTAESGEGVTRQSGAPRHPDIWQFLPLPFLFSLLTTRRWGGQELLGRTGIIVSTLEKRNEGQSWQSQPRSQS